MATVGYVEAGSLGYDRIRWNPAPGETLRLDLRYLTAQMPLVAPLHRDVVEKEGDYQMGRYVRPRTSLVLPVPASELEASPVFRAFDDEIRSGPLGPHVAWKAMSKRRSMMHATICAGLDENNVDLIAATVQAHLELYGLPRFLVGGPILGQINKGRIYFPVFPQDKPDGNAFHGLQDAASSPRTHIYLVGYYNFTDHLDQVETQELVRLLNTYGPETMLETEASGLWILRTNDDLVLSGKILRQMGNHLSPESKL